MEDEGFVLGLLLDEPADVDLLSFDAIAGTIVDALFDPKLDPIALGLTGSWGSGKTTVLRLIQADVRARDAAMRDGKPAEKGDPRTVVVSTDPWRYDPQIGAKESLIGEILTELQKELEQSANAPDTVKDALKGLIQRVNWNKAFSIAAKGALAFQLPGIDDILKLIDPPAGDVPVTRMDEFRDQFESIVTSEAFAHVQNVVVLVDDLDRCLPSTVIETLEAIRLFLSVKKMSFVIAADEDRIAEAIAERFAGSDPSAERLTGRVVAASAAEESPARLYLHKIVQTSVPVPALSDFDTQAFLVLLRVQQQIDAEVFTALVGSVIEARRAGSAFDQIDAGGIEQWDESADFAARITPIIHEKSRGNPRRIKRFLNDLAVRLSVANRRGIDLDSAKIAKLMILETYSRSDFDQLLQWQAGNELRDRLREIETQAGVLQPEAPTADEDRAADPGDEDSPSKGRKGTAKPARNAADADQESNYRPSEFMLRWARLSPPLAATDIRPYLSLAASFTGDTYLETRGLPEQLREPAQFLGSDNMGERRLITDAMIDAFTDSEVEQLIRHLGQVARDQPERQIGAITGILRVLRRGARGSEAASAVIRRLPPTELRPGVPLLFKPDDDAGVLEAIAAVTAAAPQDTQDALDLALGSSKAGGS